MPFLAASVLPGLSRAFHSGTWFPPGQVACRGLGSQGGWRGWSPGWASVSHMCPFEGHLRTLSLPSPVTAPTPVYPDPPAVHAVGGGSKAWGAVLAGGPEQPAASISPQMPLSHPLPSALLHSLSSTSSPPQPLPLPHRCPIHLRLAQSARHLLSVPHVPALH